MQLCIKTKKYTLQDNLYYANNQHSSRCLFCGSKFCYDLNVIESEAVQLSGKSHMQQWLQFV